MLFRFLALFLFLSGVLHGAPSCLDVDRKIYLSYHDRSSERLKDKKYPQILIPGENLETSYASDIVPIFSKGVKGEMTGVDGVKLAFAKWEVPNEKGAIVFTPGMLQSHSHHQELIHDLVKEGYSVYTLDPRGQGQSERLSKYRQVVHVDDFDHYVQDLKKFIDTEVNQKKHSQVFGLGYSMGGMITTLTADKHPGVFSAFTAVTPPYGINTKGIPKLIARGLLIGRIAVGKYRDYVLFAKDLDPSNPVPSVKEDSHSRIKLHANILKSQPELTMGGPSNGWLWAALNAASQIPKIARNMSTPNLLVTAQKDRVVIPSAIEKFSLLSKQSSLLSLPQAGHGIFIEPDSTRHTAVTETLRFFLNPQRLDLPATGDEVTPLINRANEYAARGDTAMARYALDEAIRVYQWKKGTLPQGEDSRFAKDLLEKSDQFWTMIESADEREQGLYVHLSRQREAEMRKLYGKLEP